LADRYPGGLAQARVGIRAPTSPHSHSAIDDWFAGQDRAVPRLRIDHQLRGESKVGACRRDGFGMDGGGPHLVVASGDEDQRRYPFDVDASRVH
jgi:hypothetical protein